MSKEKAKKEHYIDNKLFFKELVAYKKQIKESDKAGTPRIGMGNYIGQCFMDIALNLAKKPNFTNYPFKEEMISDAIENCCMYATNFNPRKSKNPFSFFTQITFYAFLRRIQKEKKQLYIKLKQLQENDRTGKFKNWLEKKESPEPFDAETMEREDPLVQDMMLLSLKDVETFENKGVKKDKTPIIKIDRTAETPKKPIKTGKKAILKKKTPVNKERKLDIFLK